MNCYLLHYFIQRPVYFYTLFNPQSAISIKINLVIIGGLNFNGNQKNIINQQWPNQFSNGFYLCLYSHGKRRRERSSFPSFASLSGANIYNDAVIAKMNHKSTHKF